MPQYNCTTLNPGWCRRPYHAHALEVQRTPSAVLQVSVSKVPCHCITRQSIAGVSAHQQGRRGWGAAPASRRSDWARSVDHTRAVRSAEADAKYWPPGQAATSHTGNMWLRNVTRAAGPSSSSVPHSLTVLCSNAEGASPPGRAATQSSHYPDTCYSSRATTAS